jgi:hypothetical protein
LINRLSVGRPFVTGREPDNYDVNVPTGEWALKAGHMEIDLSAEKGQPPSVKEGADETPY